MLTGMNLVLGYFLITSANKPIRLLGMTSVEACQDALSKGQELYEVVARGDQGKPLEVRFVRAAWCQQDGKAIGTPTESK